MKQTVAPIPLNDLCCSCGACSGVCPKRAISFTFKHGLFIPEINNEACTRCGFCFSVCPSAQVDIRSVYGVPEMFSKEEKECYIAFSNNDAFRYNGTSGGVVSTMIYGLLGNGVYEKAYVLDFERFDGKQAAVRQIVHPDDIIKSSKSKYIPASIEDVIKDVVSDSIGKSIVVATPCQLLAIKKSFNLYKRSEKEVLFIGLFCDKTLNYNIYGYYREKYGDYDSLHFRDKEGNGWPGDTLLYQKSGKTVIDKNVRISLKPYFQLNRCRFCFDKLNQLADVSCGDCYINGEESKGGKSSIIIRTTKGASALKDCSSLLDLRKSSYKDIQFSQFIANKKDNYYRNSKPNSPYVLGAPIYNTESNVSEDLRKLRLGENATDTEGYRRIDKDIAMNSGMKTKGRGRGVKYLKRLLNFIYNTDHSVNVLVDNAGFVNKGAELMLQSVVQQLETVTPKVRIVVPRDVFYDNLNYCSRHHILPLFLVSNKWKERVKKFLFRNILNKTWYVTPDQVDVILDAGGFQFSDQWAVSEKFITAKRNYYSKFTKKNRKIVFLPQAFGPFKQPMSQQLMKVVYSVADLLYARETESYNHLKSLFPDTSKIRIAPDFTCLSKNSNLSSVILPNDYVVLIPNIRMVSHTKQDVSDHYMQFLRDVSEYLIGKGETLVLLNHEGKDDLGLLLRLNDTLSQRALLLSNLDALEIKRIIGEAKLIISSRFHGVVSGLTQGVATLCTAWSHKYLELLKEHGCESNILAINDITSAKQIIEEALKTPAMFSSKEGRINSVKTLASKMWDEVWNMTNLQR